MICDFEFPSPNDAVKPDVGSPCYSGCGLPNWNEIIDKLIDADLDLMCFEGKS